VAAKITTRVTGGKNVEKILKSMASKLSTQTLRVGFLPKRYPAFRTQGSGKQRVTRAVKPVNVAQVAWWNEFGTTRSSGNPGSPPRPFFRNTIKKKGPNWGKAMGQILKGADYNEQVTMDRMGELIKGQIQAEIIALDSPPNAPRTVWLKNGASKPLVDQGIMLGSVDYETKPGPPA
jgi:hypothetical protein